MKKHVEFFGREDLIAQMDNLWAKRVPSLVTCRGRRRVGKSTLIAEFARRSDAVFIKLDGLRPEKGMSNEDQLRFFADKLGEQTGCGKDVPASWYEAFHRLSGQIDDRRKTVILLDEISWMASFDHTFAAVLKSA